MLSATRILIVCFSLRLTISLHERVRAFSAPLAMRNNHQAGLAGGGGSSFGKTSDLKGASAASMLSRSSFVRRSTGGVRKKRGKTICRSSAMYMLRNFDLPETLIFYGLDTVVDSSSAQSGRICPGVIRLIEEAHSLEIPTVVLSECLTVSQLSTAIESIEPLFAKYSEENVVLYRSSLEEYVMEASEEEGYDYYVPPRFQGQGIGHAPCPAALYDAVNTITIEPKGFGGSGGFGVKNWEAARIPLPQHVVVFISSASDDSNDEKSLDRSDGSGSISRDRCVASRACGMRVIYIEGEDNPICTAEDVSDGIVPTLGTEDDWEMVTLDSVSTPGSFWINMAIPKDEEGCTVNTEDLIKSHVERRRGDHALQEVEEVSPNEVESEHMDEEEIARMLADLDPL